MLRKYRRKKKQCKRAKIATKFKRISQVPPISCSLTASDDFKPPLGLAQRYNSCFFLTPLMSLDVHIFP